jgi:hypothetical protein
VSGLADALERGDEAPARLRDLLRAELTRGKAELRLKRSGYGDPVLVAFGAGADGRLVAALPVPAGFRADAQAVEERAWRLVAAAVGALQHAAELPVPAGPDDLVLTAGELDGALALALAPGDPELAQLAFDEALEGADRLRARALTLPGGVLDPGGLRAPIGATHPLRVAEAVARLGGDPVEPDDVTEEAVLALLEPRGPGSAHPVARPHDDPDPARRVARRILQRLDGMGKWGGYHTDFAHLARGFAGNERALADTVGEALIDAGLLVEKPSVGQRHVFLNPRRAGEIRRLIEDSDVPASLRLPDR